MRIGVVFNRQHAALAACLRHLLPGAVVESFALSETPRAARETAAALAACDHVVSQDAGERHGPLATQALRRSVRRLHLMPALHFGGFHPDTVHVRFAETLLEGPTGPYHSRLAIAGFLGGLTARQSADLFNRLSFARLGYGRAFAEERALLLAHFAAYRIDLAPRFAAWLEEGCFMAAPDHPHMRVMLGLAEIACGMMGLTPAPVDGAMPADPLADEATHPLFPDIAAAIGIPPAGGYRPARGAGLRPRIVSTQVFVAGCTALYRRTPLEALRRVQGVAQAMAALGLQEARAPLLPVAAAPALPAMLLSAHGTLLAMEVASSMIVQRPLGAVPEGYRDLVLDVPALPLTEAARTVLAGPVTLLPGAQPGLVRVERAGRFLRAERDVPVLRFAPEEGLGWDQFMLVPQADVAALRRMAERAWRGAGGVVLPPGAIRLLADFGLGAGAWRVELREGMPALEDAAEGKARLTLRVAGASRTLTQFDDAAARRMMLAAPLPARSLPEAVGTTTAFGLARAARLVVQAPAEILHAPLDAGDADRDWVWRGALGAAQPCPVGRHEGRMVIRRAPEQALLLARGLEGVLVDEAGVTKDLPHLLAAPRTTLPGFVTAHEQERLIDRAVLEKAPRIEGPAAVFYRPGVARWGNFLIDGLLALHALAPVLPPGTRLVLPPALGRPGRKEAAPFDAQAMLRALGFGHFATLEMAAPVVRLGDAFWLENEGAAAMPAETVRGFQARVAALRPAPKGGLSLLIKRAGARRLADAARVEAYLAQELGFVTVVLEDLPVAAQMDLFLNADVIVGAHGAGLANLLFCRPGTQVVELSPACEFRLQYWHLAQKLGLIYAVLPCRTGNGGFDGDLDVPLAPLRALLRMGRAMRG